MASPWKIEYDNDTGPNDDGFSETWTVTDGSRSFKCNSEDDAKWFTECIAKISHQKKLLSAYDAAVNEMPPDLKIEVVEWIDLKVRKIMGCPPST